MVKKKKLVFCGKCKHMEIPRFGGGTILCTHKSAGIKHHSSIEEWTTYKKCEIKNKHNDCKDFEERKIILPETQEKIRQEIEKQPEPKLINYLLRDKSKVERKKGFWDTLVKHLIEERNIIYYGAFVAILVLMYFASRIR